MKITFLGTSSMVPTKERGQSAIFLSYGSEGILIDCGENTQRQLTKAGISPTKVSKILITHWHGDHTLGLPGLIQSLGSYKPDAKLEIFGPKGTKEKINLGLSIFQNKSQKEVKLIIKETASGTIFENEEFMINALSLKHSVPVLGYEIVEKDRKKLKMAQIKKLGIPEGPILGKIQKGESVVWNNKNVDVEKVTSIIKGRKISFILDTGLVQNCYALAKDSNLLVCESTLDSSFAEKAEARFHLTSKQAGLIAKNSNVKQLILTHFSPRYKDTKVLEKEAKILFKNTTCAKDFLTLSIK